MGRYILKRLLSMIVIMFCAAILVFTLMYFVPGDPARLQLGVDIPENILQAKRHELGIDRPYIVQLGSFLYQAFLKLDFGYSWKYGVSVMDELITRLPRTLAIGIPAMLLNVIIGTVLGIYSAIHEGKWQDSLTMVIAMVFVSAPNFWVALMFILLFALKLNWVPAFRNRELEMLYTACHMQCPAGDCGKCETGAKLHAGGCKGGLYFYCACKRTKGRCDCQETYAA